MTCSNQRPERAGRVKPLNQAVAIKIMRLHEHLARSSQHAKKSTTLDVYQGSIVTVQRAASDKMGELLGDQIPNLLNGPVNPKRKNIAN